MSNNNLQTQTLNALHNAIMKAGGKDRPPMLAPSNYVQWKSRIKRYIDTKPNNELIHYCLQNPPYKFKLTEKTVPVSEGSSETTTEGYMKNYKNVSQDIRNQLDAEAEAVQIILTVIDNDIYSTVDACPNACEMWKAIERLKQVDSLKSQLETQKTQFLNEIDRLSREYYYVDHMNAILGVYTTLDEFTDLQCDYVDQVVKSMSRTDKNDKAFKENQSKVFLKEREQYFEIQDLKAQLQDKGIAISELKKLIEKMKGKSMETKFEKPSVIQQPNAVKSQRQSVLGMYKVHTKPNQTRTPQLPQDIRKTNKRVSFSTGVISTTSVSRPQLKSNRLEDRVMHNNSKGKKQQVEDHRMNFKFYNNKMSITACNDSLNAKTSNVNFVCVTCGKCVLNDNYDMCVLHYINGMNSRTKMPMAVPISTREPKRNVNQSAATPLKRTVTSESTNQKPKRKIRKQYEQISKTCKWWYPKFTQSGYKWKPKSPIGNVNTNVSMPLGNEPITANILEPMNPRCSTMSNTPLSSNYFVVHRDNSIHHPLWVLKAHDGKSQASNEFCGEISGYGEVWK
ncbi:hypothetical protein Tco_0723179 [Tanacetum coccineum]